MRLAEWLWENPVLRREATRRPAPTSRLQAAAGWLGTLGVIAVYGASGGWLSGPSANPWAVRSCLLAACLLYLLLLTVLVPATSAGLISGERERGTLQPLLLTALLPSQVVAGKFFHALRAGGLLLGLFAPVLLMGTHAGHLPLGHALLLLLVLAAAAFPAAAGGLWFSSRFKRSRTAVTLATLCTALLFWATLLWIPRLFVRGENLWWYASPVWQAALLCLAEPIASPLARPLLPEWACFLLFCAGMTCLPLWLVARRLARVE